MTRIDKIEKRIREAQSFARAEASASAPSRQFENSLASSGYIGGYVAGLEDALLLMRDLRPLDPRGYFRLVYAGEARPKSPQRQPTTQVKRHRTEVLMPKAAPSESPSTKEASDA